jgi:hypothetical protein
MVEVYTEISLYLLLVLSLNFTDLVLNVQT